MARAFLHRTMVPIYCSCSRKINSFRSGIGRTASIIIVATGGHAWSAPFSSKTVSLLTGIAIKRIFSP
jgi:hypothetical protein